MAQRFFPPSNLCKAEIGELEDGRFLIEVTVKKVFGLDISVNDPVLVAVQNRLRHLYDTISCLVPCVVVLKVPGERKTRVWIGE